MKKSDNPIIHFFQDHEWEWISEDKLLRLTNCTPEDLQNVLAVYNYKQSIEVGNNNGIVEYRYVTVLGSKRKAVNYLKTRYPSWVSSSEIAKAAGVKTNIGSLLTKFSDFIPVETRKVCENGGYLMQYRYVYNDRRSLLESEATEKVTA